MKHCRVRCRPFPTREHIVEDHVKPTVCETVLGDTTLSISRGLSICCARAAIDVSAINCTEHIFKKGIELGVV